MKKPFALGPVLDRLDAADLAKIQKITIRSMRVPTVWRSVGEVSMISLTFVPRSIQSTLSIPDSTSIQLVAEYGQNFGEIEHKRTDRYIDI